MANLGLIDFKLGLYIKDNVNAGKKNLKFISQNIWPKWPSIGTKYVRCHFWARTLIGHNSVIFHPILTLFFLICSFFE